MKLQEVTVPQYIKTCQFCSGNSENHLCITEILCTWGGFTVSSRVVASTSGNSTYLASIFALFYVITTCRYYNIIDSLPSIPSTMG